MIISVPVDINLLLTLLRDYIWSKPQHCPRCNGNRLWGHGFVYAFFDFSKEAVPLKRYRCPDCRCVIRLRPEGYFKRFQAPIETIQNSIKSLVNCGAPLKEISRQRQRHWLMALKRKALAVLGLGTEVIQAFETLITLGRIPVSRSI